MRVLLFGHSYVNHLRHLGNWNREVNLQDNSRVSLEFLFKSYPGKDFRYFLDHDETFNVVRSEQPDAIVVILGGNSITSQYGNAEIKLMAEDFFKKLNNFLKPGCIRFVVQVETRFCKAGNRFGAPEHKEFERRRTLINNWYNGRIKRKGLVDRVVLLGSIKFLNTEENFDADGVHLNRQGLESYQTAVVDSVRYHLDRQLEAHE